MATEQAHSALDLTAEQVANLRTLAAYLMTLPADYPDFDMSLYVNSGEGYGMCEAHVPVCGTAACAAGHGPQAGISAKPGETWIEYTTRAFAPVYSDMGDWCFGASWSDTDNTVHGAAKRIGWMLRNGVPADCEEQRYGEAPLCYTDMHVSA